MHSSIYLSTTSKPVITTITSAFTEDFTFDRPFYSKFRKKDKHYVVNEVIDDSVWIPLNISSTLRSVLWEVYFPIFSVLETFSLASKTFQIFLLQDSNTTRNQILDFSKRMQLPPLNMMSFSPNHKVNNISKDEYVCFLQSVIGIFGYDYTLIRKRREKARDHQIPPEQMHRGPTIRNFRDYLIRMMNISSSNAKSLDLVYSCNVSWVKNVYKGVYLSKKELKQAMSLREMIFIVLQTRILILSSDEDKSVALFLPDNAHLILIGLPKSDWDFWTSCHWIQVHNVQVNVSEGVQYVIEEVMYDKYLISSNVNTRKGKIYQLSNTLNVSLIQQSPPSTRIHCVGEKLFPNKLGAPHYRSCLFKNLCYDIRKNDFLIFPSPAYRKLLSKHSHLLNSENYFSTTSQVIVRTPTLRFTSKSNKVRSIVIHTNGSLVSQYYRFSGTWVTVDTVLTCNPGHLIWDYWAPIYELLDRFRISETQLLLTFGKIKERCKLPIRQNIEQLFSVNKAMVPAMKLQNPDTNFICSDFSASGFGWLNDHGFHSHGWIDADMEFPMNLHRGPEFSRLRRFILKNIHLPYKHMPKTPLTILFSLQSSRDKRRNLKFNAEIEIAKELEMLNNDLIIVHSFHHHNTSLRKQLLLSSKSSIFITTSGGGSFPAFFMPFGAVLIIYGDKNMHLDSDLYNNCGHIKVHWMSIRSQRSDPSLFYFLLCDEIETILDNAKQAHKFKCGHK